MVFVAAGSRNRDSPIGLHIKLPDSEQIGVPGTEGRRLSHKDASTHGELGPRKCGRPYFVLCANFTLLPASCSEFGHRPHVDSCHSSLSANDNKAAAAAAMSALLAELWTWYGLTVAVVAVRMYVFGLFPELTS